MKKNFLLLITLISISSICNSQTWEKLFSGKSTDVFRSVIETTGGYVAAGYTADSTANDTDAFVVKMDYNGDTIWTFKYNGTLSKKDLFYKVINTIDGGLALCGYTSSVTGVSDDLLILKLNSSGQQQWVNTWGGSQRERGQDIIQTADGKYAIVGYTASPPAQYYDAFMVRTNSSGDTLWTRRYGSANYDDANTVDVLADGGFILGGQSNNGANGFDQYLVRTNSNGDTIWTKRFGTIYTDNIESIRKISNGFIFCGSTNSGMSDDGYLVRTDTGGVVQWAKSYGGGLPDDFHKLHITTDGGYVMTGTTTSSGPGLPNIWLFRTDSSGDSLWSKTFGGDNHDHGYGGVQTSDGGYIVVGHTGSYGFWNEEAIVIKTNSSGTVTNRLVYTTVLALVSPTTTACGTTNMQIKLKLRNFGTGSIPNIPCTLDITGSLTQTIPQTFSASSDTVTFTTTINTSAGGTYTFNCFTSNDNDVYPPRNSITRTVTINVTPAQPSGVSGDDRCGPGTLSLGATATSTIYWYTVPTAGVSVNTGPTYTTPSLSNTTTYYVQTGTTCPSARLPVVATVNSVSSNPVTTGDGNCGSGEDTLTATATDPISWYAGPSGGSSLHTGNTFITPTLTSTTNYYAQASNGLCPSARVLVVALISSVAADPAPSSSPRCGPGTIVINGNSADPVKWYDAAAGGNLLWTGPSYTTPVISSTTTYYAQADNGCVSGMVAAVATVNPLAADPIPNDDDNCGPGIFNLSANSLDPLVWYDAPSGGTQVASGATFNTPLLNNSTTYYVVALNGTCPSNPVAVNAIILPFPSVNLGNDTIVGTVAHTIDAGPGFASYLWSNGGTTQTISVTNTDTFCVTVTDANGCTNSDCIFVDISTGVSEIEKKEFSLYPNPSSGIFSLSLDSRLLKSEIEIVNLSGEIIKRFNADREKIDIDLTSHAKGIYLVKINSGDEVYLKKIVVQ